MRTDKYWNQLYEKFLHCSYRIESSWPSLRSFSGCRTLTNDRSLLFSAVGVIPPRILSVMRGLCLVSSCARFREKLTLVVFECGVRCWTSYAGISFLAKNHLPEDNIWEFVWAGELFDVTDMELRCVIAKPSINVSKRGYGPDQEHLHDLELYWTGIAIDF